MLGRSRGREHHISTHAGLSQGQFLCLGRIVPVASERNCNRTCAVDRLGALYITPHEVTDISILHAAHKANDAAFGHAHSNDTCKIGHLILQEVHTVNIICIISGEIKSGIEQAENRLRILRTD